LSTLSNVGKPADAAVGNRPMSSIDARPLSQDSVVVASHLQQLNGCIGNLRAEKLDLTTQLRKHQLRISHLDNLVDQLSKQVSISAFSVFSVFVLCFSEKNFRNFGLIAQLQELGQWIQFCGLYLKERLTHTHTHTHTHTRLMALFPGLPG